MPTYKCHSVLCASKRTRGAVEQRILHLLAQGGRIEIEKNQKKRIASVKCLTRDGWHYPGGGPYRMTRRGLELVRSEFDNR